jgi:hypothetical protein
VTGISSGGGTNAPPGLPGSLPTARSIVSASSLVPIQSLTAAMGLRMASDTERRVPSADASAARFIVGAYRTVQTRRVTTITTRPRPAGIRRRP